MSEQVRKLDIKKVDTKEFEIPTTDYIHDIDNRVFQGIVLQCLSEIDGISLAEGNFIDHLLSLSALEGIKGITAEQDNLNNVVRIRLEVNICYGISIPEKAEEIQEKITKAITNQTGLHVGSVHVVFKNVIPMDAKRIISNLQSPLAAYSSNMEEEYSDEF